MYHYHLHYYRYHHYNRFLLHQHLKRKMKTFHQIRCLAISSIYHFIFPKKKGSFMYQKVLLPESCHLFSFLFCFVVFFFQRTFFVCSLPVVARGWPKSSYLVVLVIMLCVISNEQSPIIHVEVLFNDLFICFVPRE